jgi:hypothetical protein
MHRSLMLVPALLLALGAARADDGKRDDQKKDEPPKNTVGIAVATKSKGAKSQTEAPQYQIVTCFVQWGFKVDCRVNTAWDNFFPKESVTVAPVTTAGAKAPPRPKTAFTVEGTIEYVPHKVPFYNSTVEVICFVANVNVVVKDAAGKELKKIAWANLYGDNKDKGEDAVLQESEIRATRFLTVDIFHVKEIVDTIPKEKRAEFDKFLASEQEQRDKNFDDYTKHKVPDEKK